MPGLRTHDEGRGLISGPDDDPDPGLMAFGDDLTFPSFTPGADLSLT